MHEPSEHQTNIIGTLEHDTFYTVLQDEDHTLEEEMAECILWSKWDNQATPDAFGFLELAKDGGFSEVVGLYEADTIVRWLHAVIIVVYVLYNTISVACLDWNLIFHPRTAAENLRTSLDTIYGFYLSDSMFRALELWMGLQQNTLSQVSVLGFLELVGLIGILGRLLYDAMSMRSNRGFIRWFKCQKIFWETIPALSVYSGMGLLYCVVPCILIVDVSELMQLVLDARNDRKLVPSAVCGVVQYLFFTVAKFIVGFDTFLMKLRIVSAIAYNPLLTLGTFLPMVQFLIQLFGVVQLSTFVRKRLFVFIFGGEDGVMQEDEFTTMNTWNALLAKRIYKARGFIAFLVVMLSFSDMDFQSLVLNENEEKKKEIHTGYVSASHSVYLKRFANAMKKSHTTEQGISEPRSRMSEVVQIGREEEASFQAAVKEKVAMEVVAPPVQQQARLDEVEVISTTSQPVQMRNATAQERQEVVSGVVASSVQQVARVGGKEAVSTTSQPVQVPIVTEQERQDVVSEVVASTVQRVARLDGLDVISTTSQPVQVRNVREQERTSVLIEVVIPPVQSVVYAAASRNSRNRYDDEGPTEDNERYISTSEALLRLPPFSSDVRLRSDKTDAESAQKLVKEQREAETLRAESRQTSCAVAMEQAPRKIIGGTANQFVVAARSTTPCKVADPPPAIESGCCALPMQPHLRRIFQQRFSSRSPSPTRCNSPRREAFFV